MTPINAAAAHQQKTWTRLVRTNTVPSDVDTSGSSVPASFLRLLDTSSRVVHAGWKWLERKRMLQLTSRRLRLAETISLGDKRSVSIIEVDGARYLIGTAAGSVQLLAVLDKQPGLEVHRQEEQAS